MSSAGFPELIKRLPEADVPMPGIRGWLSQGTDHQVMFFEIEPTAKVPPHAHGGQAGVIVSGEMELTIGGQTRRYGPGDFYDIPAGVEHSAVFLSHFRAIDMFADVDRYRVKK